jgi:hypothetical protein
MAILYRDETITCDDDGITIDWYHFPLGTAKRITYTDMKKLETYRLGFMSGRYKYWGGSFRYWLNLDWKRHRKTTGIVVYHTGYVCPILTPDDPDAVLRILQEKTGLTATKAF